MLILSFHFCATGIVKDAKDYGISKVKVVPREGERINFSGDNVPYIVKNVEHSYGYGDDGDYLVRVHLLPAVKYVRTCDDGWK